MLLQLLIVLVAIIIGARIGGIGLGILGGFGLAVLTFIFGLQPTTPPIDVMLMIMAVIAGASCMQAAGGLNLMVEWAEKLLRKNPSKITILSPLVTYFFTFISGFVKEKLNGQDWKKVMDEMVKSGVEIDPMFSTLLQNGNQKQEEVQNQ